MDAIDSPARRAPPRLEPVVRHVPVGIAGVHVHEVVPPQVAARDGFHRLGVVPVTEHLPVGSCKVHRAVGRINNHATVEHFEVRTRGVFRLSGYRAQILAETSYQCFKRKHYVVLQNFSADLTNCGKPELSVTSCQWKDLEAPASKTDPLWSDLLESLGELGVSGLHQRKLLSMTNSEFTLPAARVFKLLDAFAQELKIDRRSLSYDVGFEDNNDSWFGIDVPFNHASFRGIDKVASPSDWASGWFGYESKGTQHRLAVWFYRSSQEEAKKAERFLHAQLKATQNLEIDSEETSAYVKRLGNPDEGDLGSMPVRN